MKNRVIFTLLCGLSAMIFSGCSMTTQYKVNSNLEFEQLPKEKRVTYEVFGKERLFKEIKKESDTITFDDEFKDTKKEIDPFEGYNRAMTSFNDYMYVNLLTPVAKGYAVVVPEPGRIAISNFFDNITFPVRFINNILQFKFKNAAEETGRFLVNSTVGILGFMDPADEYLNLQARDEDFGQTLGYYGFADGFHIVLPLLGPSNVRDIVGMAADTFVNPLNDTRAEDIDYKIPNKSIETVGISIFDTINSTSLNPDEYENLKKDAVDLYPFLKNVYNQNREKMIKE
eukprot:TRINITY_DN516671_c0_g1_i1.p1 TRINITY_DN516671_c0_g1~~TRINITY_DN516671_c0_g1_i1.p1  ORF type:complete len:286 (+),score=43.90 TRINITY_DN516671_c0_g1_i1:597-1454(+)